MLTWAGWSLAVLAALTCAGARVLGLREVFLVGVGEASLLLLSVASVWARTPRLAAARRLEPARVPVGGSCRVELVLTAVGRWATPPLTLTDGLSGRCQTGAVHPGVPERTGYRLAATQRGILPIGPLVARFGDPFGLAYRSVSLLAPDRLVVHPVIDPAGQPPEPRAQGAVASTSAAAAGAGGDFHSLRLYQDGDDLRAVHWRTSARLDALMVRQPEARAVATTIVALDLRRSVHTRASLERAVSAAAGVAASCAGTGRVRLVTTGGADSGSGDGATHLDAVLDLLAAASAGDGAIDGLARVLARATPSAVVLITTDAATELRAFGPVRAAHAVLVLVRLPFAERPAPPLPMGSPFDRVVTVPPGAPLRRAWEPAMAADR